MSTRNIHRFDFNHQDLQIAEEVLDILLEEGKGASLEEVKNRVTGKYKATTISNAAIVHVYQKRLKDNKLLPIPWLAQKIRKRTIRTSSGIAPITVLTKPYPCPGKCVYCPTEKVDNEGKTLFERAVEPKYGKQNISKEFRKPGTLVMPKSYISSEPAASRALLNRFDPWKQVKARLTSLANTGHSGSKCELIVIGGTFSFLPKRYQTWFVKRCLQSFNNDNSPRKKIEDVIKENENAESRAIGIVLETRPDHIDRKEVKRFRNMGCTRVEMGVQTLDDAISVYTKRGHTKKEVATATRLLRDAGFKICHHMMPGLPGTSEEKDIESFRQLYQNPDFKPDYVKVYPCVVTPFSELEHWVKEGRFKALGPEELIPRLLEIKRLTPEWARITRLIRDIPGNAIIDGSHVTNLRQYLGDIMKKADEYCKCIRCREIREQEFQAEDVFLRRTEYEAGEGKEIFLSYEVNVKNPADQSLKESKLIALLRLRIPSWLCGANFKPIYASHARTCFIRELHTYGMAVELSEEGKSQHRGFGKRLVKEAERIVKEEFGYSKIAIISGVGVKQYYRNLGYHEEDTYMVKDL